MEDLDEKGCEFYEVCNGRAVITYDPEGFVLVFEPEEVADSFVFSDIDKFPFFEIITVGEVEGDEISHLPMIWGQDDFYGCIHLFATDYNGVHTQITSFVQIDMALTAIGIHNRHVSPALNLSGLE